MKALRAKKVLTGKLALPLWAVLVAGVFSAMSAGADAIRVSDGDSFWMGDEEIRLWGIDAPEWDTAAGEAAEAFLQDQLAGLRGSDLSCDRLYRDRYDRWVAQCVMPSGEDLACLLVRAGHARDWPKYSGGFYRRCMASAAHS